MKNIEERVPLLYNGVDHNIEKQDKDEMLSAKTWAETKKLWTIVGPAIIGRVVIYSMNVITQSFAGHLGDLELSSMSIANNVVLGFNFGLLLGMASALETLCGQAFGAKKYHMLGIYMQRSWIVLFLFAILLPMCIFATPLLYLLGQPSNLANQAGMVSILFIPLHFSFVFLFPLQRFLQCQLKNSIIAITCGVGLLIHVFISWLFVYRFKFGLIGTALTLDFSWWVIVILLFGYISCGGCPLSWKGFSMEAFSGLWEYLKLSVASGIMLCLENWYYRILLLLTGNLKNAKIAVDALSVCMTINGWEMMIPLAFFAGTAVRVANELGAGSGKNARFATIVSSSAVLDAVDNISILLALTILLNSVQPVLSGVAVGSGWQAMVAYVNIGTYYLIGIPVGIVMGWIFDFGVLGIWSGMIGGTVVQTLILAWITTRCDWDKEAAMAVARMDKLEDAG